MPVEANVAVAILVVPLNSALNPFLYTLNVVRDKLKAREDRILSKIVERNLALEYIQSWIKEKILSSADLDL